MLSIIISVVVGGLLGSAIDSGYSGRLSTYISGPESEAIALFSPEMVAKGKGGWRGEHAGKWLYAASKAYERTGDPEMRERLVSVADYLLSRQEENGYLGCYREDKRYYHRPSPNTMKVDWDSWIMAYLIKGLSETSVATGNPKYADAALRIAHFIHWTVFEQGIKVSQTGMHCGMAGCGMLDPLCDLYRLRPNPELKQLIDRCIFEMDDEPNLQLITLLGKDYDVSLIGNGKIYEMNRCLTGLAKAYQLFGGENLLLACTNAWNCIQSMHLTTLGGPWGGINICLEIFNRPAEWAPYEVTETCSVMEWMHFTREMLKITGDGKYASELEKSAYNALMAARAADGNRWIYYVRTNGEFGPGYDWSCCWSSGMTALEDIPVYMYDSGKNGVKVNIISESSAVLSVAGGEVALKETLPYAFTGKAEYEFSSAESAFPKKPFSFSVHAPEWALGIYSVKVNGQSVKASVKDGYITVKRRWTEGDKLSIEFPYEIRCYTKTWEFRNGGAREHNFSNWYNGFKESFVSFAAGPLVFATDHLDRFAERSPLDLSSDELAGVKIIKDSPLAPVVIGAGQTTLRPICLMPAYEGPQSRFIWFRIDE